MHSTDADPLLEAVGYAFDFQKTHEYRIVEEIQGFRDLLRLDFRRRYKAILDRAKFKSTTASTLTTLGI